MTEELEATEVLPITIFDELGNHCLVAHVVGVLEIVECHHQTDGQTRTADVLDVQRTKLVIKDRPVDGICQFEQRMLPVQDLVQPRAEQITLIDTVLFWLHEITGF